MRGTGIVRRAQRLISSVTEAPRYTGDYLNLEIGQTQKNTRLKGITTVLRHIIPLGSPFSCTSNQNEIMDSTCMIALYINKS